MDARYRLKSAREIFSLFRRRFSFDPVHGVFPPGAPTLANPFTGFVLPGAGAGGINIIDNDLQNPMVHQMNVGVQREFGRDYALRADYIRNVGTHFIIGRVIGTVPFNPVVGGPDIVKNLESSVRTNYDGFVVSFERRFANGYQFRASYTLSRSEQLRQRRSDSVFEWTDRLERLAPRVWSNAKRSASSFFVFRSVYTSGRCTAVALFLQSLRQCRWTFCFPMAVRAFVNCKEMRVRGSFTPERN
jgi:hypothetical protein